MRNHRPLVSVSFDQSWVRSVSVPGIFNTKIPSARCFLISINPIAKTYIDRNNRKRRREEFIRNLALGSPPPPDSINIIIIIHLNQVRWHLSAKCI